MRIRSATLCALLGAACNNGGDSSAGSATAVATTDASASTQPDSTDGATSTAGSTTSTSSSSTSTSSTSTDTSSGVSTTSTSSGTSSSTGAETTDSTTTTTSTTGEPASTTDLDTSSSTGDTTGGVDFEGEVCALIMQKCVYSCYMLKWPCIDACIANGSPNGAAEAQAVVDCAYIDCNYDTNCYTSFCLDEWDTCVTGPMTCEELVDCAKSCAEDDELCIPRCWYESTATAKKDFDNLELCRKNQGCAELDDQCMKEFCTSNYMKCLGWP